MPSNIIDLSKFDATNNVLLRRQAKKIMKSINESDDPIVAIRQLLVQASDAYSTNNRYFQIQADTMLQALNENLRSNSFEKLTEGESIGLMRKTQATIEQVSKAKKSNEKAKSSESLDNIKDRVGDALSPFIPSPRTLMNAIKIQNPILGAVTDSIGKLGGRSEDSLFKNIDTSDDPSQVESNVEIERIAVDTSEFVELQRENNDLLAELISLTARVWGDGNDSLDDIEENSDVQIQRLREIEDETKRQNFITAERIRESEDDSISPLSSKAKKELDEDGTFADDILEGGIGGLVAGAVLSLKKLLGGGLGFLKKIPVIGTLIAGASALFDTFDEDRNLKMFGKADLDISESISAFLANFLGSFIGFIDFFLGTDFETAFVKNIFPFFDKAIDSIGSFFKRKFDEILDIFNDFSISKVVAFGLDNLKTVIMAPLKLIDSFFGTDVATLVENGITVLSDGVTNLIDKISELFTKTIPNFITKKVPEFITEVVPTFITETVPDFLSSFVGKILGGLTSFNLEDIDLSESFFNIVDNVVDSISSLISTIMGESFIGRFLSGDDEEGESEGEGRDGFLSKFFGSGEEESKERSMVPQTTRRARQIRQKVEKNTNNNITSNTSINQVNSKETVAIGDLRSPINEEAFLNAAAMS